MVIKVDVEKKQNDIKKEVGGIWVKICKIELYENLPYSAGWYEWAPGGELAQYITEDRVAEVLVAKMGNVKHRRFLNQKAAELMPKRRKGELTIEEQDKIDLFALSHFILLDWRGFGTEEGAIEYTPERAEALLYNDLGFRALIESIASSNNLYAITPGMEKN